ncbi:hypothetical protein [Actinoplanes friuliensis]|uniref:Cell wall anchor domain-containing protein n=1 Tax=Actinoplanes friuliensis DSM 7358 TaxID=1246995 RepID=U5WC59_9ACTN|nr:hypothetical protein [Actinoplanes friuliensis]AGZ45570.1 hypothetical protein AFR_36570 [Actinoplanes friuliensis DSM 7358]
MLKPLLHRAAVVAAGVILGLTSLSAVTSPAAAASETSTAVGLEGAATCVAGEWVVTWTVTNTYGAEPKVEQLRTSPAPVPELENGLYLPRRAPSGTTGRRVFTQKLTGSPASASVSFVANFGASGKDATNSATVDLGACTPPETPCTAGTFHHTFAVADGRATASVTLDDGVKLCKDEPVTLVTYFAPKPEFSYPQYAFARDTAIITNENRSVSLTAEVPKCNTQVDLFFGAVTDIIEEITENGPRYGDKKLGSSNGSGSRSEGPQGWYNGGAEGCHQPAVETLSQCDGTVAVVLSNTGDLSRYDVEFTVTAGAFTTKVTVAPKQSETVKVPAGSGQIKVTADGLDTVTYEWERPLACPAPRVSIKNNCELVTVTVIAPAGVVPVKATVGYGSERKEITPAAGTSETVTFKLTDATDVFVIFDELQREPIESVVERPANCDEEPGGGSDNGGGNGNGDNGDGGGLPVTGAAAGAIAAGAAALLAAGGVLFFLARRRRITFTP